MDAEVKIGPTMKFPTPLRILFLLGVFWGGNGCVTRRLWEEDPFARVHEPAQPLVLELFESKSTAAVLVRYSEWLETGGRCKTRAYWLSADQEPQANPHRPKFVAANVTRNLTPIPMFPRLPDVLPTNGMRFAVMVTNPPGFQLYSGVEKHGAYQLPVYADAFGTTMQIVLTPPAMVTDTVICGSVIGWYSLPLIWTSRGFR